MKELKKKSFLERQRGVTLVALVVTIIIMLILIGVTLNLAIEGGLFGYAKQAKTDTMAALDKEDQMAQGRVTADGRVYETLDDYAEGNVSEVVDWETIFDNAVMHPDQETSEAIGIGTDGNPVNMDLWTYQEVYGGWNLSHLSIVEIPHNPGLGNIGSGTTYTASYSNSNIVNGRIQGKVPQYIKAPGGTEFLPVLQMTYAFKDCTNLVVAPKLPTTLIGMNGTYAGCTNLTVPAKIPNSVQNMDAAFFGCTSLAAAPALSTSLTSMEATFKNCTSLKVAPTIPNTVTNMRNAFYGCTNLKTGSTIPAGVTDLTATFYGCSRLTGTLRVDATGITDYEECFYDAATTDVATVWLAGNAGIPMLNTLAQTGSQDSEIVLYDSDEEERNNTIGNQTAPIDMNTIGGGTRSR